jgi:hypothetical protein
MEALRGAHHWHTRTSTKLSGRIQHRFVTLKCKRSEASILSGGSRKCSMRSAFFWFAEFCHSQRLSHLAASFIVVRAETSIAKSCEKLYTTDYHRDLKSRLDTKRAEAPHTLQVFEIVNRVIDPSAGSPTETLLRLLLPLSNKVHWTFQIPNWRTNKGLGPNYSPDCSIGRSDGRCVQRAGT